MKLYINIVAYNVYADIVKCQDAYNSAVSCQLQYCDASWHLVI